MNFILVGKMGQEVAVIGERGQVVIPKELRARLGLNPKTKLLVIEAQFQSHFGESIFDSSVYT